MTGWPVPAARHLILALSISPGEHITTKVFGLTLNLDTIYTTLIAGAIVVGLGLWMRFHITAGVPGKLQLLFEMVVDAVQKQVESAMGPVAPFVVPLAVTLFFFILIANWIELIPSGKHPEYLPSPTADVNLTYAMAFFVIIWVHVAGVRQQGAGRYFGHFTKPYKVMLPIHVIEELVKPFTLALRLFGNIFSGGIMIALLGGLPAYLLWAPTGLWKLFDGAIGVIQAFIFALLTILYFGFALTPAEH